MISLYPSTVLALAVASAALGHVLGARTVDPHVAFAARLAGALVAASIAMSAGVTSAVQWLPKAVALPALMYAPFAVGWLVGGRRSPMARFTAMLDIVGLTALTVAGTTAVAVRSGHSQFEVFAACAVLVVTYLAATVYAGSSEKVYAAPPLLAGVLAWIVYVEVLACSGYIAGLALALSPLLVLGASMSLLGRMRSAAR